MNSFQCVLYIDFFLPLQGKSWLKTFSPYHYRANYFDMTTMSSKKLQLILIILSPSGSIELRLNDMVRAAKSSTKCKIALAKDRASPRFSIFRAKKMKGWWPLIRQKTAEDFEREEKEKEEAKKKGKKKKKKDKRSAMRQEDIQFTDSSGSTFLLMVYEKTTIC